MLHVFTSSGRPSSSSCPHRCPLTLLQLLLRCAWSAGGPSSCDSSTNFKPREACRVHWVPTDAHVAGRSRQRAGAPSPRPRSLGPSAAGFFRQAGGHSRSLAVRGNERLSQRGYFALELFPQRTACGTLCPFALHIVLCVFHAWQRRQLCKVVCPVHISLVHTLLLEIFTMSCWTRSFSFQVAKRIILIVLDFVFCLETPLSLQDYTFTNFLTLMKVICKCRYLICVKLILLYGEWWITGFMFSGAYLFFFNVIYLIWISSLIEVITLVYIKHHFVFWGGILLLNY